MRCEASVTPDQISAFSNIYRHTSPFLTLYHLTPSSTNLYWPNTSQYRHILTQYHQVPLIIHHLVSHSSAIWIISLFTTPLKSHAQYTWSSYKFPFKLQLSGSKVYPFPEPIGIHIPNPEGPSQFLLRRSRTSHVCRQHEFLYPWIHVMGVDAIPYILIFDLSPWSQCCHSGLCQRSGKSGRQTPALRVNSFTWNNNNISLSAIVSAATMIIYIIVFIILFETYGSITSRQY